MPSKLALLFIPLIFPFVNVVILIQNRSSGQLASVAAFISFGGHILDTFFFMYVFLFQPNYLPLGTVHLLELLTELVCCDDSVYFY